MTNGIPTPSGTAMDADLFPIGWFSVGDATTGLDPSRVNPKGPMVSDVVKYLNTLIFTNLYGVFQRDDIWDCTERALWGVVNARHRFPGCAIGMAEGVGRMGSVANKRHAVLIIWEKGLNSSIYWDALYPKEAHYVFDPNPARITAFPIGADGQLDTVEPIRRLHLPRLRDRNLISWDQRYSLYPPKTASGNGVLDYLNNSIGFDPDPMADQGDVEEYWRDMDRAFWAYIHVRRAYPGCAIGVASGVPADGHSTVVNVVWYKDGMKIKALYHDPSPDLSINERDVTSSFKPKRLFY